MYHLILFSLLHSEHKLSKSDRAIKANLLVLVLGGSYE